MGYVLNSSSRTVHDIDSTDGRCRLSSIDEENRYTLTGEALGPIILPAHACVEIKLWNL